MNIEVSNQSAQIAVAIGKKAVTMETIHAAIDELSGKLMKHMAEQGTKMAGAPYLAYLNASDDFSRFDIEWGFPVVEPVTVSGEIFMSQTCEGKAITAMHKGPYSTLETTYCAVMDYAKEHSLESTGVYYDYYLNDPDETPENELLTQVVYPVK